MCDPCDLCDEARNRCAACRRSGRSGRRESSASQRDHLLQSSRRNKETRLTSKRSCSRSDRFLFESGSFAVSPQDPQPDVSGVRSSGQTGSKGQDTRDPPRPVTIIVPSTPSVCVRAPSHSCFQCLNKVVVRWPASRRWPLVRWSAETAGSFIAFLPAYNTPTVS